MFVRTVSKYIATLGPLGFLPAPGTWGSLATLPCAYVLSFVSYPYWYCAFITLVAYIVIRAALPLFMRTDPQEIILDEFVGCLWALCGVPFTMRAVIIIFCAFRFFDITKIAGIRACEKIPGAWGVIADDCGAAFFARVLFLLIS